MKQVFGVRRVRIKALGAEGDGLLGREAGKGFVHGRHEKHGKGMKSSPSGCGKEKQMTSFMKEEG